MKTLRIEAKQIEAKLGDVPVNVVIQDAAALAHRVLEELSIYRQRNGLESDIFDCEAMACEFLDQIGD